MFHSAAHRFPLSVSSRWPELPVFAFTEHELLLITHIFPQCPPCRPDYPIFAFTENELVQRRLALYHGINAAFLKFSEQQELTFDA